MAETEAEAQRSMQEVATLAAERRRFEGWIAALEARRDSTPPHVFERVLGDYRERLNRVNEQLGSHHEALEEERASLASRLALLEGEEQMRRDERAELELRSHVGELTDLETEAAFVSLDESLKKLAAERETLTSSIAGIQALLAGDQAPRQRDPQTPAGLAQLLRPIEKQDLERFNQSLDPTPVDQQPVQSEPPAPQGDPLSDLVRENSTEASLLDDLLDPAAQKGGEAPMAANVPANTPIVLRPSGPVEQSKTLKCQECGALNYPTEWYCERCGAELAAL